MNDDPGIVCFQHCTAAKIFCYQLPAHCPLCRRALSANDVLPFRLPYPFVRPHQHPCAIILKPTAGDFMNDYFNSMDLHIGVTTSTGTIVEFDERGLQHTGGRTVAASAAIEEERTRNSSSSSSSWSQSLLVDAAPEAWWEHWDDVLRTVCSEKPAVWSAERYDGSAHNCYTFVLSFLQRLDYGPLSRAAHNRQLFCEEFIMPRTTTAGKYISLYRKLRSSAFYVHDADAAAGAGGGDVEKKKRGADDVVEPTTTTTTTTAAVIPDQSASA